MGVKEVLVNAADTIIPDVEERTTLLIDLNVDTGNGDGSTRTYTYAALYVAGRWYVTGKDRLLSTEYKSTVDLMTALARFDGVKIELASEFETVRG